MKKKKNFKLIFIIIIIFMISIISITNGGMWGDEIVRVFDPISGNLLNTIKTSLGYAQPGYMLYMFLWERLTFSSMNELIIRCSNLLFIPITIFYVYKIVKAKNWNLWFMLLFFIHPMFVYYMNEATPYIIVYTLSLAFIYHVFIVDDFNSVSNIIKINLIYLIGVFVHFIFGFIIIPYIVKCLLENYRNKEIILKHIKILLIFSILYAPLLILYIINLKSTTTGFGLKNIAYVLYGFLGMAGIGLSRNNLRALDFNNISINHIISLFIMTIACIGLLYFALKNIKNILRDEKKYLICLAIYFIVIFGVAFVIHFGVWERHCFTIFPLFMIIFIDILNKISKNKNCLLFISIYLIMLIFSSINIRFNYYYQCDDYKGIYEYVKENNLSNIMSNYNTKIYSINDLTKKNIYLDDSYSDNDIINQFKKSKKTTLILFEKNSSKYLYNYFKNEDYIINNNYNSFKIITHK